MSGLTETERRGCERLLKGLSTCDLMSLSDTVTNKMIRVENTEEAMAAILSYTNAAEELLKRKKVHRDAIFKYLASEGVVMSPHSEKHQLVRRTLKFWSTGQVAAVDQSPKVEDPCSSSSNTCSEVQLQPAARSSLCPASSQPGGFDPLALGQQFCRWFFQLLNSHNPSLGQQPQDWGPQHFWPDVKMCLLSSADGQQTEEFHGAELVSLRLLALTKEERLLLSPNMEAHGLRALASPHGPVLVAVAGTIHRGAACLGVYEQVFGLVRSPLDDTWKIKFVNMKIRGQGSVLGGAEVDVTSPALTCDSSELQLLCR